MCLLKQMSADSLSGAFVNVEDCMEDVSKSNLGRRMSLMLKVPLCLDMSMGKLVLSKQERLNTDEECLPVPL